MKGAFLYSITLSNFISEPDSERIADVFDDDKTHDNTQDGHLPEAFYETYPHPPENETDEETSEITVPHCCPCFLETELERCLHILPMIEEVTDTFEEENIAINRYTDRENYTSNTGECQGDTHESHESEEDNDIDND